MFPFDDVIMDVVKMQKVDAVQKIFYTKNEWSTLCVYAIGSDKPKSDYPMGILPDT